MKFLCLISFFVIVLGHYVPEKEDSEEAAFPSVKVEKILSPSEKIIEFFKDIIKKITEGSRQKRSILLPLGFILKENDQKIRKLGKFDMKIKATEEDELEKLFKIFQNDKESESTGYKHKFLSPRQLEGILQNFRTQ